MAIEREIIGTDGGDFADFCHDYLQHSIGRFAGKVFDLEDWQRAIFDEALEYYADGTPAWTMVVLVLPRKNGKTQILAAYALWRLLVDDGMPEILLAASSDKQAGRLFEACVAYIRGNPALDDLLIIREHDGEIVRVDGGGIIRRMASDPKRIHGYNPSLVICDEVAQWTTPLLRSAWDALITGDGARESAQVFAITTPGEAHTRATGILGRLIDRTAQSGETELDGVKSTTRSKVSKTIVYQWSAPWPAANPKPLRDAHAALVLAEALGDTERIEIAQREFDIASGIMLPAWKQANPASWITEEYLIGKALGALPEASVLQLHAGVWAEGEDQWLTADAWAIGQRHSELQPGDVITLGFDGSRVSDATALIACRLRDGLIAPIRVWECPEGAAGRFWNVPRKEVDAAVAWAFETYDVTRMYADPPDWRSEIDTWALQWPRRVIEFPTSGDMRMGAAVERFTTDLAAGELGHTNDPTLTRHIGNAIRSKNRHGYRITKPAKLSERKIDAAVAAVIAYEARCDSIAAGETGTPAKQSRKVTFH